jgi:hypothetical protein
MLRTSIREQFNPRLGVGKGSLLTADIPFNEDPQGVVAVNTAAKRMQVAV